MLGTCLIHLSRSVARSFASHGRIENRLLTSTAAVLQLSSDAEFSDTLSTVRWHWQIGNRERVDSLTSSVGKKERHRYEKGMNSNLQQRRWFLSFRLEHTPIEVRLGYRRLRE